MIPKLDLLPHERKLLGRILREAAEVFENHGCNDWPLENTPENLDFAKRVEAADVWNPEELEWDSDPIYLNDSRVMDYFADIVDPPDPA